MLVRPGDWLLLADGRRGLELEVAPSALVDLLGARFVALQAR
jgi:prolyl-tRNA editing enzyme YbaK/EbsC (Cys-tRNA(Pro) deacylase)